MRRESVTKVMLTIRQAGKEMPYAAGTYDGRTNYGFKLLKGANAEPIPEASGEAALARVISAFNEPDSVCLTLGCDVSIRQESGGHTKSGYIEFALDSLEAAGDIRQTLLMFYLFDAFLTVTQFNEAVRFHWEIEGNQLPKTKQNFASVACWIDTPMLPTPEQAAATWDRALDALAEYARSMRKQPVKGTTLSSLLAGG